MRKPPPRPAQSPEPEGNWEPPKETAFDNDVASIMRGEQDDVIESLIDRQEPNPSLAAKVDKAGPIYLTAFVALILVIIVGALVIKFLQWLF